MRFPCFLVLALLALVAVQSPLSAQVSFSGTEVRLGEARDEVMDRLSSRFVLQAVGEEGDDQWVLQARYPSNLGRSIGNVRFSEGRLVFISRSWGPDQGEDSFAGLQAVIGALAQVVGSSTATCSVSASRHEEPGAISDQVEIRCGRGAVSLGTLVFGAQRGAGVSETWTLEGS